MDLPHDLLGGWEYKKEFISRPLEAGQIWRKRGPIDAVKIVRMQLPNKPNYDGAAPGISVRFTKFSRGKVVWEKFNWFWLGTETEILQKLREDNYAPTFNTK